MKKLLLNRLLPFFLIVIVIFISVSLYFGRCENNLFYTHPHLFVRFSEPYIEMSEDTVLIFEKNSESRYILGVDTSVITKYADICSTKGESTMLRFLISEVHDVIAPLFYQNITDGLPDSVTSDLSRLDAGSRIVKDHSHPENLSMILVPDCYWNCQDVINHYPIRIQSDHIELEKTDLSVLGYPVWCSKEINIQNYQLLLNVDDKRTGRYVGRLVRKK